MRTIQRSTIYFKKRNVYMTTTSIKTKTLARIYRFLNFFKISSHSALFILYSVIALYVTIPCVAALHE